MEESTRFAIDNKRASDSRSSREVGQRYSLGYPWHLVFLKAEESI